EDQFYIETRRKSAASAHAKASAKNKTIEQLGDKFGFRIVLRSDSDSKGNFDTSKLDQDSLEELLRDLGIDCRKIYADLIEWLGRVNRNSNLKKEFANLITLDPRLDDKGQPTG